MLFLVQSMPLHQGSPGHTQCTSTQAPRAETASGQRAARQDTRGEPCTHLLGKGAVVERSQEICFDMQPSRLSLRKLLRLTLRGTKAEISSISLNSPLVAGFFQATKFA